MVVLPGATFYAIVSIKIKVVDLHKKNKWSLVSSIYFCISFLFNMATHTGENSRTVATHCHFYHVALKGEREVQT